jgi:hypothetical protein
VDTAKHLPPTLAVIWDGRISTGAEKPAAAEANTAAVIAAADGDGSEPSPMHRADGNGSVHHCALDSQYVCRRPHCPSHPACTLCPAKCVLSVCILFDVRICRMQAPGWSGSSRERFSKQRSRLYQIHVNRQRKFRATEPSAKIRDSLDSPVSTWPM